MMECVTFEKDSFQVRFHTEKNSMIECAHEFPEASLFEGKKLPEIEREAQWIEDAS